LNILQGKEGSLVAAFRLPPRELLGATCQLH
jgi:hypothetical protein